MARIPAEVWPLGEHLQDEMSARGWSLDDLHRRLGDNPVTCCAVDLILAVHDKHLILDAETADALGRAFDLDPQYLINLDHAWRESGSSA